MAITGPFNDAADRTKLLAAASTTDTITLSVAPASGTKLIVQAVGNPLNWFTVAPSMTGVTGWQGPFRSNALRNTEIWVGDVGASAGTILTLTGVTSFSVNSMRISVSEFAGIPTPFYVQCFGGAGESTTNPKTATITPVPGSDVLLVGVMNSITTVYTGPTNSFTALTSGSTAASFSYRIVTGASGSYATDWTYGAATNTGTMLIAISGTPPSSTAVRDAWVSFVAANGGNAVTPLILDRRANVSLVAGDVSQWDDAIYNFGGRPQPPFSVAGVTAAQRPTMSGTPGSGTERIPFVGTSSEYLVSLANAAYDFSVDTPLYIGFVGKATGVGPLAHLCVDETSDTTYPYAGIEPHGTTWKASFGTAVGGTPSPSYRPDSNLAFTDGVRRVAMMGKAVLVTGNPGSDVVWRFFCGGRQIRRHAVVTTATAGALKLVLGRLGAVFGTGEVDAVIVTTAQPTRAYWMNVLATSSLQHGAVPDSSKRHTWIQPGDSLRYGSQSTAPMTPAIGSGTTSAPSILATLATGKGTLASQNIDVGDIHGYNYGISGRNLRVIVDQFDVEIAPNVDGTRSGRLIVTARGIGNTVQGLGYTLAQLRAVAVELRDKVWALGGKLIWETEIDRGAGANGSNANATAWYLSGPVSGAGISVHGQTILDFNTDLRTNLSAYGDYLVDIEAEPGQHCAINRAVTLACNDVTYYNADKTHGQDLLYTLMGTIGKTALDTNANILSANSLRRRRR